MKRRVLLVDDEVAVLLTLKAVLEISGYDVETAASAREGKHRILTQQFDMVITDMRMESDASGAEVIRAARTAEYHPAVALLTAFPLAEEDWQGLGADKMLVKPMQTRVLLQQIERLLESHQAKLAKAKPAAKKEETARPAIKKAVAKKTPVKKASKKSTKSVKKTAAKKTTTAKPAAKKSSKTIKKAAAKKSPTAKPVGKKSAKAVKKTAAKKTSRR